MFNFKHLDSETRAEMLRGFDAEQMSGRPYMSQGLSPAGIVAFPKLMRAALESGNEETLRDSLLDPRYWNPEEPWTKNGVTRFRRVNIAQAAERLASTEFNTWYVHGLSARALALGIKECTVYRAAQPKWEPAECSNHEGAMLSVKAVHDGHRARYWPAPGNSSATSVPFGPGCHHTIDIAIEK